MFSMVFVQKQTQCIKNNSKIPQSNNLSFYYRIAKVLLSYLLKIQCLSPLVLFYVGEK